MDRRQVLAYRTAAQGLDRREDEAARLAALDLGIQDTPRGAAAQGVSVRLGQAVPRPEDGERLAITWSMRGAPHLHRVDDLGWLARALWPWSDDDALARLDTSASPVRASGLPAREALRLVAEQIAEIVTEPMPKGQVSTALTPRLPDAMLVDCRVCEATHVVETLFRSAVLPAGIRFAPGGRSVVFVPAPDWPGVPTATGDAGALVTAYLRLLGPAGPGEVAAFLGTTAAEVAAAWPDDLAEVEVAGHRTWLPAQQTSVLADPPEPPAVRLLPPSDVFLQARDRELIAPDEDLRAALWPVLGRPGALLVDGDVAGTWRARKKGRRLAISVEAGSIPRRARAALDDEAELVAAARGASGVELTLG